MATRSLSSRKRYSFAMLLDYIFVVVLMQITLFEKVSLALIEASSSSLESSE